MDANFKKPLLVSPDSKKQPAPAAALPVDVNKEASLLLMDIKKLVRLPPFQVIVFVAVNLWALISACVFGSFSAYNVFGPNPCDRCSASTKSTCYVLTDAAGQEANAMVYWAVWCSVLQAAAAVLALLLPAGRRRRTLLAYAALAATTAVHCMYGRALYLLVATYPRERLAIAALLGIFMLIVFDLICFLLLNPVGDEEETEPRSAQTLNLTHKIEKNRNGERKKMNSNSAMATNACSAHTLEFFFSYRKPNGAIQGAYKGRSNALQSHELHAGLY